MEARIKKLEVTTHKAHQQAWAVFEHYCQMHLWAMEPIKEVFIQKLLQAGQDPQATVQTLWPDVIPGFDPEPWATFLDQAQLLQEQADTDLTIWPSDLPTPPQEPPGLWEKLLELRNSPDEQEVMATGFGIMALSYARAVRG
ncbi:hypothetical protein [Meiothermus sp. CFH 77666]|uniref:hypothetical protein n=1 Tax=Meiothermus sp. CFH 77666 TaxID=2817942 RepID=UPI001AA080A2|nr:hypothetical protein [Meiothermus sp. CFH 77666]MBO1436078.1 hypothetical protein [Meiothermus sp. CFH 77666]